MLHSLLTAKQEVPMTLTTFAPIIVTIAALTYLFSTLRAEPRAAWLVPAAVSVAFFLWSAAAILQEGLFGFWSNHTSNLWGNQVWFDLLFAIAIGWTLILPRAKAQGMRTLPWLVLICATGCIGFLAMLARLFFLEERSAKA
jgi:hypothetical protein